MPRIIADYVETGQVYYVYKDFPLYTIHLQAIKAAEAAECAGVQGSYWEMHDLLFANQQAWSGKENAVETFIGFADELGLDVESFQACLEEGRFTAEVQADLVEGQLAGTRATPTFFINGQKTEGAVPYAKLRQLIEQELAKQ